jgi:hypothetical protein
MVYSCTLTKDICKNQKWKTGFNILNNLIKISTLTYSPFVFIAYKGIIKLIKLATDTMFLFLEY